jgi:pimeloyl-ACP methyl ester carboxylesterase
MAANPPLPDVGDVQRLPLHGRTVAYRQLGAGPVVVLVHGLAGTMSTWDPAIPQLSKSCTVVAVDLPGHGRSAAPHRREQATSSLAARAGTTLGRDRTVRRAAASSQPRQNGTVDDNLVHPRSTVLGRPSRHILPAYLRPTERGYEGDDVQAGRAALIVMPLRVRIALGADIRVLTEIASIERFA